MIESSEVTWVEVYQGVSMCVMLGVLGIVFLMGVNDFAKAMARPHLREGQPFVPHKRLLGAVAVVMLFFLLSLVWPLVGPADTLMIRAQLAIGMLLIMCAALPAWRLAYNFPRNPEDPPLQPLTWRKLATLVAIMYGWNIVFTLTFPQIEMADGIMKDLNLQNSYLLFLFCGVGLLAPISEEIVYRGVIQPFFGKFFQSSLPPIMIAGYLWAIGHVGMIDPPGLKEIQIMGLALIFGYARNVHGLSTAILLHLINNALVLILQWVILFAGIEPPK